MAYIKVYETSFIVGKPYYTSEILNNKIIELKNSGDIMSVTVETLPNGNRKDTMTWRDEATYNSFVSWVISTGESTKLSAYNTANNITRVDIS